VHAFPEVTKSVPIVAFTTDPVREGLAASLARPGGNITGVTTDAGVELMGKYLEILKEAMPSASKFAYLGPAFRWEAERPALLEAARQLGVSLVGIIVDSPFKEPEFRRAFAAIVQERVVALMVGYAGQFVPSSQLIVELARQNQLPAIYPYRGYMDEGGLMAYALEIDSLWMQADSRPTVLDYHLDVITAAYPQFPIVNPTRFAKLSPTLKLWTFGVACGFALFGPDPTGADWFAVTRG
jgi:putative tryptophan/tyrosine transport system substrate-binding protein